MRREKSVVLPGKITSRKWLWLGSGVFIAIALVMASVWAGFPRKKQTITAILSAIRELMSPTPPKRRSIGFTADLEEK